MFMAKYSEHLKPVRSAADIPPVLRRTPFGGLLVQLQEAKE